MHEGTIEIVCEHHRAGIEPVSQTRRRVWMQEKAAKLYRCKEG